MGDQAWTQPTGFGGANFLFMENNVFNSGASNDCTKAGRFVARFNALTAHPQLLQRKPTQQAVRDVNVAVARKRCTKIASCR